MKIPLTPANSISVSPFPPALTPDNILYEQIRQQFQTQLQLQEQFQVLLQSQQNGNGGIGIGQGPPSQHDTTTESSTNGSIKDRKETREELMQRHGFH